MNTRILIIGGGLSGLATAFRLASQEFDITIVDKKPSLHPISSDSASRLAKDAPPHIFTEERLGLSNSLPMVIHGFHHATWALLKELTTDSLLQPYAPTHLEFVKGNLPSSSFNPILAPAPFHTLIGLLRFTGLPFSDRWALVKNLEKLWEGESELPQNLESQNVHSWLSTLGQSDEAVRNIWDPLCRYFLGTDSCHSSAHVFTNTLAQCFLTKRRNEQIFTPPHEEETLFLRPIQSILASKNIMFYPGSTIQIHSDPERVTGVRLSDGTTMTADYYISAIPRRVLISCLPERLLAKFAYFSNLSKLSESSTLVIHIEVPHGMKNHRLFLSTNSFNWITTRPKSTGSSNSTLVSCVATDHPQLLEKPDHQLLDELPSHLPSVLTEVVKKSSSTKIIRNLHGFLACQPGISGFRPLSKSPIPNFFLAGPWTDTGLPSWWESSIMSGNLCAQAVINSLSTH